MADERAQPEASGTESAQVKPNGKGALLRVTDPQGFEIRLDLDTWEKHITVGHPEMKDYLELLSKTLSEPEVIQRSPLQPETHFYYRLTGRTFHKRNDIYLSAVVHRSEETKTGFVKTAHLVKKIRKEGETVWLKRN